MSAAHLSWLLIFILLLKYSKQTEHIIIPQTLNPKPERKLALKTSFRIHFYLWRRLQRDFLSGLVHFLKQFCTVEHIHTQLCESTHSSSYSFLPCSFKHVCVVDFKLNETWNEQMWVLFQRSWYLRPRTDFYLTTLLLMMMMMVIATEMKRGHVTKGPSCQWGRFHHTHSLNWKRPPSGRFMTGILNTSESNWACEGVSLS